jgi:hypothetical protein
MIAVEWIVYFGATPKGSIGTDPVPTKCRSAVPTSRRSGMVSMLSRSPTGATPLPSGEQS